MQTAARLLQLPLWAALVPLCDFWPERWQFQSGLDTLATPSAALRGGTLPSQKTHLWVSPPKSVFTSQSFQQLLLAPGLGFRAAVIGGRGPAPALA